MILTSSPMSRRYMPTKAPKMNPMMPAKRTPAIRCIVLILNGINITNDKQMASIACPTALPSIPSPPRARSNKKPHNGPIENIIRTTGSTARTGAARSTPNTTAQIAIVAISANIEKRGRRAIEISPLSPMSRYIAPSRRRPQPYSACRYNRNPGSGSRCSCRSACTHNGLDDRLARSRCDQDFDRQYGNIVSRPRGAMPPSDLSQEGRNAVP
jgi:hypothetical protein